MILSQTAKYALRAVLYLADSDPEVWVRVDDIAEALDVPRNYLSKILHTLARTGILESTRGPRGGFRLAADPEALHLTDVVGHFDDIAGPGCFLEGGTCSESEPCAAHTQWRDASRAVTAFFDSTTIADLAKHSG